MSDNYNNYLLAYTPSFQVITETNVINVHVQWCIIEIPQISLARFLIIDGPFVYSQRSGRLVNMINK